MSRIRAIVLTAVSLPLIAFAQATFDTCQLTIHVRTEGDRDYTGHAQVELASTSGTPVGTSVTNANGTADFQVPSGTLYRVRISGHGIETMNYEFRILGGDKMHMENVSVKLSSSSDKQQAAQGVSPTISVAEMNVPTRAKEEMQKGMEAFSKGDMAMAQQRFEKAISIYPQYARAYANLGIIAVKSGDRTKGRSLFSKAIEVDDQFLPGYVDLARLDFQDKNYAQAESLLQKVVSRDASMPDALALLASTEYVNKEYDNALADAQRVHALPNHEQFADVHLVAGKILEMKNRSSEAIAEYQLFLKEAPSSPNVPMVQQQVAHLEADKH